MKSMENNAKMDFDMTLKLQMNRELCCNKNE